MEWTCCQMAIYNDVEEEFLHWVEGPSVHLFYAIGRDTDISGLYNE